MPLRGVAFSLWAETQPGGPPHQILLSFDPRYSRVLQFGSMTTDLATASAPSASSLTLPASPPADPVRQAQTRLRLLEAAAGEFAERGFHKATVRDICKRAGANVAAVNYHFGDKGRLFVATVNHWVGVALDRYPPLMGVAADAPAAERFGGFVRGTLHRMLDDGSAGWHGQLMAREMVEPTCGLDVIIDATIRPMVGLLNGIVRELAPAAAGPDAVRWCVMSVVGQCCFYRHSREVVKRLVGPDLYTPAGIEAIAEHVVRFSLVALAGYGDGPVPPLPAARVSKKVSAEECPKLLAAAAERALAGTV